MPAPEFRAAMAPRRAWPCTVWLIGNRGARALLVVVGVMAIAWSLPASAKGIVLFIVTADNSDEEAVTEAIRITPFFQALLKKQFPRPRKRHFANHNVFQGTYKSNLDDYLKTVTGVNKPGAGVNKPGYRYLFVKVLTSGVDGMVVAVKMGNQDMNGEPEEFQITIGKEDVKDLRLIKARLAPVVTIFRAFDRGVPLKNFILVKCFVNALNDDILTHKKITLKLPSMIRAMARGAGSDAKNIWAHGVSSRHFEKLCGTAQAINDPPPSYNDIVDNTISGYVRHHSAEPARIDIDVQIYVKYILEADGEHTQWAHLKGLEKSKAPESVAACIVKRWWEWDMFASWQCGSSQ